MPERQPLTFWDHVDELRRRLIRSIVVLVVAATGGFWLSPYAQSFLVKPFVEHVKGTLALLAPGDGFVIQVKLGIMLGLIIASPFVAYQMYGFIGPGLKPNEKAWLWPVVTISTILFWGGVVFAWYIMPAAIEFLGSFAEMGIQNMWSLKTYISLIIFLLLSFGVIFQLPLSAA